MKPVISSRKHVVQHTQFTVASAATINHIIVNAVETSAVNASHEVIEGTVIKAVYIERWLFTSEDTGVGASFVFIVEKVPADAADPTFTNMGLLDSYSNKKNILYTSQGLLGLASTNPTPVIRQWIKIPKGKQRFGLGDQLKITIAAIGANDVIGCGLAIYKGYS